MVQLSNRAFARRRELAKEKAGRRPAHGSSHASLADESWNTIFQAVPAAVLVGDMNGNLLATNTAGTQLMGFDVDAVRRLTIFDVVAARDAWTMSEFGRFKKDRSWRGELDLRRSDGSVTEVDVMASSVTVPAGDVFVAFIQDGGREQRWRVDRVQESLGELRASVDPILSLTSALQREESADKVLLDQAQRAADYLSTGLKNLLEASAFERGRWPYAPGPTDMAEIVETALERAIPRSQGRNLSLLSPRGVIVGSWDAKLLRQTLDALLDHAIARSMPGSSIRVTVTDSGPDVIVGVSDEGPSLDAFALQTLFREPKGAKAVRLDLYVTRRSVEAQGGHMWAQSDHLNGTTCYFSLPRQAADARQLAS
jgi:PAS domain S-box-containing protein